MPFTEINVQFKCILLLENSIICIQLYREKRYTNKIEFNNVSREQRWKEYKNILLK